MTTDGSAKNDKTMNARECPKSFFGADKGRMKIIGDIVSPMPAEWFEDPDDSGKELF